MTWAGEKACSDPASCEGDRAGEARITGVVNVISTVNLEETFATKPGKYQRRAIPAVQLQQMNLGSLSDIVQSTDKASPPKHQQEQRHRPDGLSSVSVSMYIQ